MIFYMKQLDTKQIYKAKKGSSSLQKKISPTHIDVKRKLEGLYNEDEDNPSYNAGHYKW